jgi:hypothetical protein
MLNIPTVITSGGSEVVASGSVTAFSGHPIEISLGPLKFLFEFVTKKAVPQQNLLATVPQPNSLRLELTNFDNPLGTGSIKPLPVGSMTINGKNRVLYLHLRVYAIGEEADKTLNYTFYVAEEVPSNGR